MLKDVAAKNNISITSKTDQEAYLAVLQAADVTAQAVNDLPDYIDPRLSPVPTAGGPRQFRAPDPANNTHNAWVQHAELRAEKPLSDLLKGKTVGIKDNMSVGGLPYTCGMFPDTISKDGKYPLASIDSTVVRRVLEAGGTIAGITTCENYSLTPMSYTSANGPVHNPWLRDHNTGGSTSGGACALSLRRARQDGVPGLEHAGPDVDIQIGGDQAGSIRMPSSLTGVYGLKPTHGLVPYTGISGLHPMIDHAGPMAHNVDDVALMLTALAGYDGLDGRMTPESPLRENVRPYHLELAQFAQTTPQAGKGIKVGIITESLTTGTAPEVATIVETAAMKHFAANGASVFRVSVPTHLLGPAIWTAASRTHMASLTAEGRVPDILTHNLPHFTPKWPPDQEMFELLSHHNPAVINIILSQTFLTEKFGPEVQAKAHRHVFQLRAAYDMALAEFDVLITPTTQNVAPAHPDMRKEADGGSGVMDKMRVAVGSTNQTCPFNITGHPAMSVPCGWAKSADGKGYLPVGMQIIGKRWDDMTVLKAAKVFELGGGGLPKWPGKV